MNNDKTYRVGWVIPAQVGALTHYTPDVQLEEFQEIAGEAAALFADASQPFHVIIDNRMMEMAFLPDLNAIKRAAPYTENPHLRTIIMIKPEQMEGSAADLTDYRDNQITLTYVDSLADAARLLKAIDDTLRWHQVEVDFFPDATFE